LATLKLSLTVTGAPVPRVAVYGPNAIQVHGVTLQVPVVTTAGAVEAVCASAASVTKSTAPVEELRVRMAVSF